MYLGICGLLPWHTKTALDNYTSCFLGTKTYTVRETLISSKMCQTVGNLISINHCTIKTAPTHTLCSHIYLSYTFEFLQ